MAALRLLTTLLSLSSLVHAATTLQLYISPSPQLPDPSHLPSSTHLTITGDQPGSSRQRLPLLRDNSFKLHDLDPGSYLVDVHTRDYVFPSLRVDVHDITTAAAAVTPQSDNDNDVEGSVVKEEEGKERDELSIYISHPSNPWHKPGAKLSSFTSSQDARISVSALQRRDFYAQRTGFDILGVFKSPMILMGVASLALVVGMPYLMENMDPETKAEFEEMQRTSGLTGSQGAASQLQNFDLAGWMAGKSSGDSAPAPAATAIEAPAQSKGGRR